MFQIERRILKKYGGSGLQPAVKMEPRLSELFHENTKLTPLSSRSYGAWIAQIARSDVLKRLMATPYKVYSLMDQVPLAPASPSTELERLIESRRSVRAYSGAAMTGDDLSRLLFYSYGRTDRRGHFRAVASGGGLYPLEIYAFARNVEGLELGTYHYEPEHHRLDRLESRDCLEELKQCVWFEDIDVDHATVVFVVTAVFQRTLLKYSDRGYRMVLMEAGEVAQNMALLAATLDLGACLVGGFHDDALSRLLGIDGCDEAPLLPVVVGRRKRGAASAQE